MPDAYLVKKIINSREKKVKISQHSCVSTRPVRPMLHSKPRTLTVGAMGWPG